MQSLGFHGSHRPYQRLLRNMYKNYNILCKMN